MLGLNQYFEQQAKLLIKKTENLKNRSKRQYVYRAALLTVYGFQVAIPVVVGIFLGLFLDKHYPSERIVWTLNLILIGFLIGLYNANTWLYHMIKIEKKTLKKGVKK